MSPAEKLSAEKSKTKEVRERRRVVKDRRFDSTILGRRESLKLSLRDIEIETGIAATIVNQMERGVTGKIEHALTLARFFGVPVEQLFALKEDPCPTANNKSGG